MKSIFVSSTFRDMQAERDALMLGVVPNLSEYARAFGENIRFVDLRWGVNTTDLDSDEGSQKVLSVCLDEIDNTRPCMIILVGERYGWIPPEKLIRDVSAQKEHKLYDADKSVTELEIEYGALAEKGQLDRCLFYFRDPLPSDEMEEAVRDSYIENTPVLREKLEALKQRILASGAAVKSYHCEWDTEQKKLVVPDSFIEMVTEDVKQLFAPEFQSAQNLSVWEREELDASLFAEQKCRQFSGRYELLDSYLYQIKHRDTRLFILKGKAGSGKSTMTAKIAEQLKKQYETLFIAMGNSARSQTVLDVLRQIVYKLETVLGVTERFDGRIKPKQNESETVEDENKAVNSGGVADWSKKFAELAFVYSERIGKPLYIVCDALDQLMQSEDIATFKWLPTALPDCITVVLSSLTPLEMPLFYPLRQNCILEELTELTTQEKPAVVKGILGLHGKELENSVVSALLSAPGSDNPLYISMMLQRLVMLDSDDFKIIAESGNDSLAIDRHLTDVIRSTPDSVELISAEVLKEAAERINSELCFKVVALLAASRRGLRDNDLEAILTRSGTEWSAVDFSRLVKYMQMFFLRREDGRLDFAHSAIRSGFLQSVDSKIYNSLIIKHLLTLDMEDELRVSETVWHLYKDCDAVTTVQFIESYLSSDSYEDHRDSIAEELYRVAMEDCKFARSVVGQSRVSNDNIGFAEFILNDLYFAFGESLPEYEVQSELFFELLSKLKTAESQTKGLQLLWTLFDCYNTLVAVLEPRGENEQALKLYVEASAVDVSHYVSDGNRIEDIMRTYDNLALINNNVVELYITLGDLDEALKVAGEQIAISNNLAERFETYEAYLNRVSSLKALGNVQMLLLNYDGAKESYSESKRICRQVLEREEWKDLRPAQKWLTSVCSSLDDLYRKQNRFEEALSELSEMVDIREVMAENIDTPFEWSMYAAGVRELGHLHFTLGDNDNALLSFEKSRLISETNANEEQTITAYEDLALHYKSSSFFNYRRRDAEQAKEDMLKAIDLYKRISDALKTPSALGTLADCYFDLADIQSDFYLMHELALSSLEDSQKIREMLAEKLGTPDAYTKLNDTYREMIHNCDLLDRLSEVEELSKSLINNAVQMFDRWNSPEAESMLASSYSYVAGRLNRVRGTKYVAELYNKAHDIRKRQAERYDTDEARGRLAESLGNLAELQSKSGNDKLSLELFLEAHDIYIDLAEKTINPTAKMRLANSYSKIAEAYARLGDNKAALEMYEQSRAIYSALADEQSAADAGEFLAEVYYSISKVHKTAENPDEAIKHLRISNAYYKTLAQNKRSSLNIYRLSRGYTELAKLYLAKDKDQKALEALEQARELIQKVIQSSEATYFALQLINIYESYSDLFLKQGTDENKLRSLASLYCVIQLSNRLNKVQESAENYNRISRAYLRVTNVFLELEAVTDATELLHINRQVCEAALVKKVIDSELFESLDLVYGVLSSLYNELGNGSKAKEIKGRGQNSRSLYESYMQSKDDSTEEAAKQEQNSDTPPSDDYYSDEHLPHRKTQEYKEWEKGVESVADKLMKSFARMFGDDTPKAPTYDDYSDKLPTLNLGASKLGELAVHIGNDLLSSIKDFMEE